jgi:hypothetical protein
MSGKLQDSRGITLRGLGYAGVHSAALAHTHKKPPCGGGRKTLCLTVSLFTLRKALHKPRRREKFAGLSAEVSSFSRHGIS